MISPSLPPEIAQAAVAALDPSAPPEKLSLRRVGGGCIHPAAHLSLPGGAQAFLKWAEEEPSPEGEPLFQVEAEGLEALDRRGGIRIPKVLGVGRRWLLLEYLPPAPPEPSTPHRLGEDLARLHRPLVGESPPVPGWSRDGWIGSLPQDNTGGPAEWPDFWREKRLLPQLRRGHSLLPPNLRRTLDRVLDRLEEALAGWEEDGLSLLHGDLWSGNLLVTGGGEPALVDPAAYRGHREVDLAMMELFGGFAPETFRAYDDELPPAPGSRTLRRHVYQLYPLLVHLNLFGTGYLGGVRRAAEGVLET